MLEITILFNLFRLSSPLIKDIFFSSEEPEYYRKIRKSYYKSVDIFQKKYKNQYGKASKNILSKEKILEEALKNLKLNKNILRNSSAAQMIPDEVIVDFIEIFENEIQSDNELNTRLSLKKLAHEISELRETISNSNYYYDSLPKLLNNFIQF